MFAIDCEMPCLIDYLGAPLYLLYQIKKQAIHITKRVLLLMSQIEHIFVADSLLQTPEPRLMPIS